MLSSILAAGVTGDVAGITYGLAAIGPGAGLSFLGSLWAVLVGIVLALVAILSWPIRLLWRRLRGSRAAPAGF